MEDVVDNESGDSTLHDSDFKYEEGGVDVEDGEEDES